MAVRIPIITVFDSKGLRQAQYQLNKVRGNFQNLGRNAAIAGAAIGAFGAVIATSARSLARIEKINAQTNAVLKSTGTIANGTAKDIENLAGRLEALTATEAETIQEGANLLLTFKNIRNEAGAGNDIFNQTTAAMVDVARAMGTTASGEAIRLGKALNDPVKGISALTRVGITFTEQQKAQIKALSDSGDVMGAQKIILAELQSQFGGSGAAFAQTFTGQLELLQHELGTVGEEATMAVMPALREMIAGFREIIPIIGPQLKAAIESVDWKAFSKSIVDLTTFLIQNAETIMRVVGTLFILNTAYNAGRVAVGLYNAAAVILNNTFVVTAGKIGLATGAVKLFRTALITTGIGALVVGLGFVIEAIINTSNAAEDGEPKVNRFTQAINNSGNEAKTAANKYRMAQTEAGNYIRVLAHIPKAGQTSVLDDYAYNTKIGQPVPGANLPSFTPTLPSGGGGGGGGASSGGGLTSIVNAAKQNEKVTKAVIKLQNKGLSAEVAQWVTTAQKPVVAANEAIKRITKNGAKAVANLTKSYNKSAAGQAAASAAAEAAASAAAQAVAAAAQAAAQAAAEQAAKEAAILAEKQRVYESFANAVNTTFANIKNSIVGAFSLPQLGGSTDSIIRNMDKLLARVKSFSQNITKLSSMGLDPELLQQVIQAGPVAGARLAAGLVAGGSGALSRINAGFGEIQGLGSEIGMTGTQARFGTQTQQNIYNINVEGGVGSGATIGKAIVDAIKAYERTSGAVWQGA
jgi:hypothetical protein